MSCLAAACRSLPTLRACGRPLTDIVRGRLQTDDATRAAALALGARIDAAAPYFRDTGLFGTFASWPADWDPAVILGLPVVSVPPEPRRHSHPRRQQVGN